MQTYLLSDEDVRRYALDCLSRLDSLGDRKPAVWVTLGLSGDKMADVLDLLLEVRGEELPAIVMLSLNRSTSEITIRNEDGISMLESAAISDRPVLILDSAVHSGKSMQRVAEFLLGNKIKEIVSYSLVIKQTSEFIPTFFGLMINECDRAFFQLDAIPNHRLNPKKPIGWLRRLQAKDVDTPFFKTRTSSINHTSFGDLFYGATTHNFIVYVYEIAGRIAGALAFKMLPNRSMFIDLIARDEQFDDAKIGGLLMRWAETYARHANCLGIELRAVETEVNFYERFYFKHTQEPPLKLGGGESYYSMKRKLLYNMKPQDQVTLDYLSRPPEPDA